MAGIFSYENLYFCKFSGQSKNFTQKPNASICSELLVTLYHDVISIKSSCTIQYQGEKNPQPKTSSIIPSYGNNFAMHARAGAKAIHKSFNIIQ